MIHDWHEHAADAVQMHIARSREYFAGGYVRKLTRLPSKEREEAEKFYASHTPCAHRVHAVCPTLTLTRTKYMRIA